MEGLQWWCIHDLSLSLERGGRRGRTTREDNKGGQRGRTTREDDEGGRRGRQGRRSLGNMVLYMLRARTRR
jgi:hypothetical protein